MKMQLVAVLLAAVLVRAAAAEMSDATVKLKARRIQRELIEGAKFPDFNEEDVAGKPLSVSSYRGKVVLVDFWATWCAPCAGELPNILKIYEKHHSQGFEIIGISLDKDESKLTAFTRQKKMGWRQIFDGKGAGSKLADNYGIITIPATFLLDAEGKIIAQDLKGNALEEAVAKALDIHMVDVSPSNIAFLD